MDGLHGAGTFLHGVHGLEVDIGILDGHHLRLKSHAGAHNFVNLAFVRLLSLKCHERRPLVLVHIRLGDLDFVFDLCLQEALPFL